MNLIWNYYYDGKAWLGKLIPLSVTPESKEDIGSILSLLELKMSHRQQVPYPRYFHFLDRSSRNTVRPITHITPIAKG